MFLAEHTNPPQTQGCSHRVGWLWRSVGRGRRAPTRPAGDEHAANHTRRCAPPIHSAGDRAHSGVLCLLAPPMRTARTAAPHASSSIHAQRCRCSCGRDRATQLRPPPDQPTAKRWRPQQLSRRQQKTPSHTVDGAFADHAHSLTHSFIHSLTHSNNRIARTHSLTHCSPRRRRRRCGVQKHALTMTRSHAGSSHPPPSKAPGWYINLGGGVGHAEEEVIPRIPVEKIQQRNRRIIIQSKSDTRARAGGSSTCEPAAGRHASGDRPAK